MRLKLIISASLLAAVLGAGACTAILLAFFSSLRISSSPGLLVVSTFVLPTAAIVFASVFVYRHTSRRRKLQAVMTALLSIILTISFFVIASIVTSKRSDVPPPPTSPIAVKSY
jgi:chromate transport protein ChrA